VSPAVSAVVVGVVAEILPHAMYRVRIEGGHAAGGHVVQAHIADRADRNFVRVLVGDRVEVELSAADTGRGRIVRRI
jgi:translation initiation factor IF-1